MRAFNKQGRHVSDSMRVRQFTAYLASRKPRPDFQSESYRGFEISGRERKWFVKNDPRIFTSKDNAKRAVDITLELRELVKGQ